MDILLKLILCKDSTEIENKVFLQGMPGGIFEACFILYHYVGDQEFRMFEVRKCYMCEISMFLKLKSVAHSFWILLVCGQLEATLLFYLHHYFGVSSLCSLASLICRDFNKDCILLICVFHSFSDLLFYPLHVGG